MSQVDASERRLLMLGLGEARPSLGHVEDLDEAPCGASVNDASCEASVIPPATCVTVVAVITRKSRVSMSAGDMFERNMAGMWRTEEDEPSSTFSASDEI